MPVVGQTAVVGIEKRIQLLERLFTLIKPIPSDWVGDGAKRVRDNSEECNQYGALVNAWRRAVKWIEGLDYALANMFASVVSVKAVGDPLWIKIMSPASTGKTMLAEALSVCKEYIEAVDTMTGLISGYQVDQAGTQNMSMVERLRDKTLIIKDGDTILTDPQLPKILAQFRALYDRNLRTRYGNKMSADHEGVNTTVILCGTSSLHRLDKSELGERFLDCSIMNRIDPELEDEIIWRKANQAERSMNMESNGQLTTQYHPELAHAMRLTGGYVRWLRENAFELFPRTIMHDNYLRQCMNLAKFVAFMRARPSDRQEEVAEREMACRLVSQLTRLAKCLAVVLNKPAVDNDVLSRVRRVAIDTSQGQVLKIVAALHELERQGMQAGALALSVGMPDDKCRKLLRFLRHIEAVEYFEPKNIGGVKQRPRWRLTTKVHNLYSEVMHAQSPQT